MDESRRKAIRAAHTKHIDHCSCGEVACGNGGRASHRAMHERRQDGHHALTSDEWYRRFLTSREREVGWTGLWVARVRNGAGREFTARILTGVGRASNPRTAYGPGDVEGWACLAHGRVLPGPYATEDAAADAGVVDYLTSHVGTLVELTRVL